MLQLIPLTPSGWMASHLKWVKWDASRALVECICLDENKMEWFWGANQGGRTGSPSSIERRASSLCCLDLSLCVVQRDRMSDRKSCSGWPEMRFKIRGKLRRNPRIQPDLCSLCLLSWRVSAAAVRSSMAKYHGRIALVHSQPAHHSILVGNPVV